MTDNSYTLQPVGVIRSDLTALEAAPRQGYEGAPDAWIEVFQPFEQALHGIRVGKLSGLPRMHLSHKHIQGGVEFQFCKRLLGGVLKIRAKIVCSHDRFYRVSHVDHLAAVLVSKEVKVVTKNGRLARE